jgi:hypothetical protein
MDFATILEQMLLGFSHIAAAPFQNLEIWWYLFPILALWITLEFYFGLYKSESMGWNTALGNAFSFAWVNIEGMRVLFEKSLDFFWFRFGILSIAIAYSCMVIYLVFTHRVKDKYAFLAASPHVTYFLSAVSIMWMHGVLVIDFWVLLDLFILFWFTVVLFIIIKKILPQKAGSSSSPYSSGNDDYAYEKVGFNDSSSSTSSSMGADSFSSGGAGGSGSSSSSNDSGSALDFMNMK